MFRLVFFPFCFCVFSILRTICIECRVLAERVKLVSKTETEFSICHVRVQDLVEECPGSGKKLYRV